MVLGGEGHGYRSGVLSEMHAAQDGVLSDSELNDFQVQCFAVPLQPEELAGVKAVVSQKMPEVRDTISSALKALVNATCLHHSMATQESQEKHLQQPAEGGVMRSGARCQDHRSLLTLTDVPAGCRAFVGAA